MGRCKKWATATRECSSISYRRSEYHSRYLFRVHVGKALFEVWKEIRPEICSLGCGWWDGEGSSANDAVWQCKLCDVEVCQLASTVIRSSLLGSGAPATFCNPHPRRLPNLSTFVTFNFFLFEKKNFDHPQ